jgi:hypothetical protein
MTTLRQSPAALPPTLYALAGAGITRAACMTDAARGAAGRGDAHAGAPRGMAGRLGGGDGWSLASGGLTPIDVDGFRFRCEHHGSSLQAPQTALDGVSACTGAPATSTTHDAPGAAHAALAMAARARPAGVRSPVRKRPS